MATIKDIAREANVSVCTVSRYLNNKIVIRKETEQRIDKAIEKLGYVPNVVAKALKCNTTSNIAVIVPRINNPYYSEMVAGISETLCKHRYNLFLCEMDSLHASEEAVLQIMRQNLMAGAIFAGFSYDRSFQDTLGALLQWNIPVVYLNRYLADAAYPLVYPDFIKAGVMAARHLLSGGKKRLAAVYSDRANPADYPQIGSFRDAVMEAGLAQPLLVQCASEPPSVAPCLQSLVEAEIDGAFVLNETTAAAVVRGLAEAGMRAPADMAVLAFGSSALGGLCLPGLTCIDTRNHTLGVKSAEILLRQIRREPYDRITVLDPRMIRRESG